MKLLPIGERLYIRLDAVGEKKTEGGILLPDRHGEILRRATILGIGENVNKNYDGTEVRDKLNIGDRIAVNFNVGDWDDRLGTQDTLRIISKCEVLGIITEE